MCEISEVQVVSYFAESDDETGKPKLGQAKEKLPQRANLRGVRAAALRSGAEDQFHLRTARLTRNSSRLSSSLAPPRINGVERTNHDVPSALRMARVLVSMKRDGCPLSVVFRRQEPQNSMPLLVCCMRTPSAYQIWGFESEIPF
jgi:hypothetical protein